MMTLAERALRFNRAVDARGWSGSKLWPSEEAGHAVYYGRWVLGPDFRGRTGYPGEYRPGYLARLELLFPDMPPARTLHVFSGGLPKGDYTRVDVNPDLGAEITCDVVDLPRYTPPVWRFIVADPPYTADDARRLYGVKPVNRIAATNALAEVARPGAWMAWLDGTWPMHQAVRWQTSMRIAVTGATNQRLRDLTVFERRVAA